MSNIDAIINDLKTNLTKFKENSAIDKNGLKLDSNEATIFEEYDIPVGYNQGDGKLDLNELNSIVADYEDDKTLNNGQTKTDNSKQQESFLEKLLNSTTQTLSSSQEKSITVDAWEKGPNDCLSNIVKNNYGVNPYSKEGKEIMQNIIENNPEIYASGRKGIVDGKIKNVEAGDISTVIYTGDKIKLPSIGTDNATTAATEEQPEAQTAEAAGGETGKTTVSDNSSTQAENSVNPEKGEADRETATESTQTPATGGTQTQSTNPEKGQADGKTAADETQTKEAKITNKSSEKPSIGKGILAGLKGIVTKGIGGIVKTAVEHPVATGAGIAAAATALAFVPVVGWVAIGAMGIIGAVVAVAKGIKEGREIADSYKSGDAEAFYKNCEDMGGVALDLGLSVAGTAAGIKGVKAAATVAKTTGTIFNNPLSGIKSAAATTDDVANATDDVANATDDVANATDDVANATDDVANASDDTIKTQNPNKKTAQDYDHPPKNPKKEVETINKNKNTMKSEMGQQGLTKAQKTKLKQPKCQRALTEYQNAKKFPDAKLEGIAADSSDPLMAEIAKQALNLRNK